MLQIHTQNFKSLYRPYDFQGTILPSAKKAEWLKSTFLKPDGSSGYLGPGAFARMLE